MELLADDPYEELKPGSVVYVAEAFVPALGSMVYVDSIIDDIESAAYDFGGEYADGFPQCTAAQKEELHALVVGWLEKLPAPHFYTVKNSRPYTLTEKDF